MPTNNTPELHKVYNCFDDGKIRPSRMYDVILTEIIKFEDADEDLLGLWNERKKESPDLFDEVTDYFLIGDSFERDDVVDRVFFARSKSGWFGLGDYFCSGRLDVSGELFNSIQNGI